MKTAAKHSRTPAHPKSASPNPHKPKRTQPTLELVGARRPFGPFIDLDDVLVDPRTIQWASFDKGAELLILGFSGGAEYEFKGRVAASTWSLLRSNIVEPANGGISR